MSNENDSFDEWWESDSGWGGEHLAEYQLARAAWFEAKERAFFEAEKMGEVNLHRRNRNYLENAEV